MFLDIFNGLKKEAELNDKQFAEKSGIPYSTVRGWTVHGRLPDYNAIIKIADFFEVSADFLLGRENAGGFVEIANDLSVEEKELITKFRRCSGADKEGIKAVAQTFASRAK